MNSSQPDRDAFEQVPRADLTLRVSRRRLWSAIKAELLANRGLVRGIPALKLSELGRLPDDELAQIIPGVAPGCGISVRDQFVWGQLPGNEPPTRLFPLGSPALMAFNLFNGQTPLGEVAEQLAVRLGEGWDAARAFALARGLFLALVVAGICRPVGVPSPGDN